MKNDLDYHRTRAMTELDLALNADSFANAEAHFRLSSMHLKRAESLAHEHEVSAPLQDAAPKLFSF